MRIDATSTLKQLRKAPLSKVAWARVLTRAIPVDNAPLHLENAKTVNYETLRLGRVRLDAFCMLVFRKFFHSINMHSLSLHLFSDGSPQWRGVELLASSFDLFVQAENGHMLRQRRHFPAISIGAFMFGALGKAITLLWQIWLMAGPSYTQMRNFLARVRSLTVDMGTERLLADFRDILPAFFNYIKAPLPNNVVLQPFLFPRCVMQPGMRHNVDRLIKRGLLSLKFFPSFLDGLKAVNRFVREYRSDIIRELKNWAQWCC
jgi:hypothetical protein